MMGFKDMEAMTIRRLLAGLAAVSLSVVGFATARADTVISVTQYSYNGDNQLVCTAVRMNPATFGALSSDACAPMATVGANGPDRITANIYDAGGQLTAIQQAYGTSNVRVYASYTYTDNGLKKTETDANNNKTTFAYDGFDRLITLQYPNTALSAGTSSTTDYEAFTYDANDNRKTWRRRNGQTITYTYDNLNREVIADIPAHPGGAYNATEKDIYTTYDAFGRVLKKAFASYTGTGVSYTYNGLGWVATTTDMSNRTLTYLYNAAGARVQMTDPNGYYVVYGLDNLNRVQKATLNGTTNVLYSYTYNAIGQRTLLTKGAATTGGGTTTYAYDNLGRLQGMAVHQATAGYDITWGKVGTVGAVAYNAANQITTWASNNTVFDYVEIATAAENRAFDGLNRDAAIAAVSGGYDASGNLTKDTPRSFIYDIYNRLLIATGGASNFSMSYDPEGRLVNITTGTSGRDYLYDGTDMIAEYVTGSTTPASRFIFGSGSDDPTVWLLGADDSNRRYYYTNYQGSVLGYVAAAGQFILGSLTKYDPYGVPHNSTNAETWSGMHFGYTGQRSLPNASLYYYKARVYDPKFGRFLQTDPVGSADDLDLYAYVGGDPVNHIDPTGTITSCPLCFDHTIVFTQKGQPVGRIDINTPTEVKVYAYAVFSTQILVNSLLTGNKSEPFKTPDGREIVHGPKTEDYIKGKGWTPGQIDDAINDPDRTYDNEKKQGRTGQGTKTIVDKNGNWVVVNDKGQVIQVQDKNNPRQPPPAPKPDNEPEVPPGTRTQ